MEIVNRILAALRSNLRPEIQNRASGEIRHQCLDSGKARRLLGWRPMFTLEDALERTIRWYREFLGVGAKA